jgi:polygalacturonase
MSCSHVTINDIFMRNSDDCIAIYGHRWQYYGDTENWQISDAILWADVAHPINIGTHGNAEGEGETIANIHFSNIDILEHDEDAVQYQGCMAFSVCDNNFVRDVVFENVRIEKIEEGQLFNLRVFINSQYSPHPGRGIQNILFKNIYFSGEGIVNPSVVAGYDATRTVENVTFENIVINGKKANTCEDIGLQTGDYSKNIVVK